MKDKQIGISLRVIREWKPDHVYEPTIFDKACALAMSDDRDDVTVGQKLKDALTFLRRGIH